MLENPSKEMLVFSMPLDTFIVQRNIWVPEEEDVPGTLEVLLKGSLYITMVHGLLIPGIATRSYKWYI